MSNSFPCGECKEHFGKDEERWIHRKSEHLGNYFDGQCALCAGVFATAFHYFDHFTQVHAKSYSRMLADYADRASKAARAQVAVECLGGTLLQIMCGFRSPEEDVSQMSEESLIAENALMVEEITSTNYKASEIQNNQVTSSSDHVEEEPGQSNADSPASSSPAEESVKLDRSNDDNEDNENESAKPGPSGDAGPPESLQLIEVKQESKSPTSYSNCIVLALMSSPTGQLPVSEIYAFVREHFDYFKTARPSWKNSIRHQLSVNKNFAKVELENPEESKGCLWTIRPERREKVKHTLMDWRANKQSADVKDGNIEDIDRSPCENSEEEEEEFSEQIDESAASSTVHTEQMDETDQSTSDNEDSAESSSVADEMDLVEEPIVEHSMHCRKSSHGQVEADELVLIRPHMINLVLLSSLQIPVVSTKADHAVAPIPRPSCELEKTEPSWEVVEPIRDPGESTAQINRKRTAVEDSPEPDSKRPRTASPVNSLVHSDTSTSDVSPMRTPQLPADPTTYSPAPAAVLPSAAGAVVPPHPPVIALSATRLFDSIPGTSLSWLQRPAAVAADEDDRQPCGSPIVFDDSDSEDAPASPPVLLPLVDPENDEEHFPISELADAFELAVRESRDDVEELFASDLDAVDSPTAPAAPALAPAASAIPVETPAVPATTADTLAAALEEQQLSAVERSPRQSDQSADEEWCYIGEGRNRVAVVRRLRVVRPEQEERSEASNAHAADNITAPAVHVLATVAATAAEALHDHDYATIRSPTETVKLAISGHSPYSAGTTVVRATHVLAAGAATSAVAAAAPDAVAVKEHEESAARTVQSTVKLERSDSPPPAAETRAALDTLVPAAPVLPAEPDEAEGQSVPEPAIRRSPRKTVKQERNDSPPRVTKATAVPVYAAVDAAASPILPEDADEPDGPETPMRRSPRKTVKEERSDSPTPVAQIPAAKAVVSPAAGAAAKDGQHDHESAIRRSPRKVVKQERSDSPPADPPAAPSTPVPAAEVEQEPRRSPRKSAKRERSDSPAAAADPPAAPVTPVPAADAAEAAEMEQEPRRSPRKPAKRERSDSPRPAAPTTPVPAADAAVAAEVEQEPRRSPRKSAKHASASRERSSGRGSTSRASSISEVRRLRKRVKEEEPDDYIYQLTRRSGRAREENSDSSKRRSIRTLAKELKMEEDADSSDVDYWMCHTASPDCPRCDERFELKKDRIRHYQERHYDEFYRSNPAPMNEVDRWVSCRFGQYETADDRVCLLCNESPTLHPGRIALIKHQKKDHKIDIKLLKEEYRLYSRTRLVFDMDAHKLLT